MVIGMIVIAVLPLSLDDLSLEGRLWVAANPGMIGLGFLLARAPFIWPKRVVIAWVVSFFVAILLLRGIGGVSFLPEVSTTLWGGLLLNLILAVVGIVASFPLGILLALGRRSNLPAVSWLSILFIETVRGMPLVTLLFMTQIILPLFLPEDLRIDRITRAILAITLFSSAYMAENVRGGLQAVPGGQVEAAKALAEILIEKKSDRRRIETAFSYALARKPSPTELETLEAFVNRERVRFENEENQSEAFLKVGLTNSSANDSPVELAALASLSRAILNLHETITRY